MKFEPFRIITSGFSRDQPHFFLEDKMYNLETSGML